MHVHCLVPYTPTTETRVDTTPSRILQNLPNPQGTQAWGRKYSLPFHQKRNKATGGQAAVSTVSTLESRTSLASDLWPPPPWPGKQRNAAEFAVISSARASPALTTERLQHHVIDWFQSSAFRQQRLQSPWLEHVGVSRSRWCALSDVGAGSQILPTWQVSARENRKDGRKRREKEMKRGRSQQTCARMIPRFGSWRLTISSCLPGCNGFETFDPYYVKALKKNMQKWCWRL